MPIIKSAIKRAKQATVRRERNVGLKRDIKAATKAFQAKPDAKTLAAAHGQFDTAVKKGLLKKNTAARRKSRFSAAAKEAGVKLSTAKKPAATKPATKTAASKPATAATKKPATKAASKTAAKKPAAAKPAAKKPASK